MTFHRVDSGQPVAEYLAKIISAKLNNDKKVLWLVTGGSTISVAVEASRLIQGVDSDLYIALTDERPGTIGHADSNWLQLQKAGLAYTTREYYEILQNKSDKQEVIDYDAWLGHMLSSADYKIGFFGIGPDGHTAGILPGGSLKSSLTNAGYWDDGQRQRISITPEAIAKLDEVVIYLTGEAKQPLIDKLKVDQDPLSFPAHYLKSAGELTVYNDWVEEGQDL